MEEQNLDIVEELSGQVDFVPTDVQNSVQRSRKNAHVEFNVFGLNNMKNMARFWGTS